MSTAAAPIDRTAGVLVPLFSIPSSGSWGIGEIADLPVLARWLRRGGRVRRPAAADQRDGARGRRRRTPRSARWRSIRSSSACARSPTSWPAAASRGCPWPNRWRSARRGTRRASTTPPSARRRTRRSASRSACSGRPSGFAAPPAPARSPPTARSRNGGSPTTPSTARCATASQARSWTEWDAPLRDRDPEALDAARRELEREVLYYQYLQWLAEEQWQDARAASKPVRVFGDFPFMVSTDSADVWARQDLFRFDRTVGVPPDAFSATGQDWGLPVYRWDRMVEQGDAWLQAARAPHRAAVRRLPHRSPRRLLPHLLASARRAGGRVRSAGPGRSARCRASA